MRYNRFEEVPVWQDAIKLAKAVYALRASPELARKWSLCDQLERAAVSISNNIAEGFERGSIKELINYIFIARGSAGEVRSMLCLIEEMFAADPDEQSGPKSSNGGFQKEVLRLKNCSERISRQLYAWAQALKISRIVGQSKFDKNLSNDPTPTDR